MATLAPLGGATEGSKSAPAESEAAPEGSDGEPAGSAGAPAASVLKGFSAKELTAATAASKRPHPSRIPHLNAVFLGDIGAGKDTACGTIMWLTNVIHNCTNEKCDREADRCEHQL